ncbi:MAG TPA: DEAD/DEAH box helicase [Puia sp.]|nr:DEAD/DEAH box helicase [Puia sp.]
MQTPRKTIILPSGGNAPVAGLLLNFNHEKRGGLAVELLLLSEKKEGRSYQRIPLAGGHYKAYLQGFPAALATLIRRLSDEALLEHLVQNGFAWLRDADKPFDRLEERHLALLREYIGDVLQELRPLAPAIRHLHYLPQGEPFFSHTIRPAAISPVTPELEFRLERRPGRVYLLCSVRLAAGVFPLDEFQQPACFLKSGNEFFLLNAADRAVLRSYRAGQFEAREEGLPRLLATIVKPLAECYKVDVEAVVLTETVDADPRGRVYVSELNENFLLIKPKWDYAGHELENDAAAETRIEHDDRVFRIVRKKADEARLTDALKGLHRRFEGQGNGYFYLTFREAMEKNWFVKFYRLMQEMDIPVLGMNRLRKFKYNTNPPSLEIVAGRGIDWFDLTIRVSYGGLVVPLHELRKAILGKQDFILLPDGSLGILPKEWIDRYSLLLKMGQVHEGGVRLSAVHWGLMPDAGGGTLQAELEEKRRRWEAFHPGPGGDARSGGPQARPSWEVPAAVQATLRDYQVAGFRWMCLLDEMGWGGCLADDMGLGKTLQTLAFLQYVVERYPDETHLVVCPTSLLYNWEDELKKFAPRLDYHLHYGAGRELDEETFRRAHVIVTSLGMVRNDIRHFAEYRFGYVILDESQAIKNPASQVRRAVQQLRARNRMALSGTPVQNNTFDLYAQMDFLNPGMLGSADFFRSEFATPIDRHGDAEAAARLRKLVYPFILRRTKEQVARDLPDRTEMILWCEMGDEQRRIYNSHKEHYRESLLSRIAEEGMGKSSLYILEGLTKLRQICDSPALVKEDTAAQTTATGGPPTAYPNVSIKLEELVREIEENTGHHKALVFSQFTSMLALIRAELGERGIRYLYLDGSVAAEDRKAAVARFQEDEDVRVFLISLKAGGVGLTLTAADYVYLVDPWWNPAAEQQAIDRSHRIGQARKVFAYRMICKDTVEEKILMLQQKKKSLAADLVTDESGFVKQLTSEDVAYLFS